jgi:hypothetical protein
MSIKSFITLGPGVNLTNIVSLSQTKRLIKLERLSLSISSDIEYLQVRPGVREVPVRCFTQTRFDFTCKC